MKPAVSIVDELLEAGINVTVYNGQLDLIVDTMGRAQLWKQSWVKLEGNGLGVGGINVGRNTISRYIHPPLALPLEL